MGLDIYLYRYDDFEAYKKRTEEVKEKERLILEEVAAAKGLILDELSDKDKDNAHHLFKYWCKGQPDLDEYGDVSTGHERIEQSHPKYPDHLFKIGYLRSSYNGAGINNVLRDTVGYDLYYIFQPGDKYEFQPGWSACLDRAEEVFKALQYFAKRSGNFWTQCINFNPFVPVDDLPNSEKNALERFLMVYEDRMSKPAPTDDWGTSPFSNRGGTFAIYKPYNVVGIFPGTKEGYMEKLTGKGAAVEPCVYLVMKSETNVYTRYLESLEITIDMIKYVLSRPDPENYILHWSG